MLPDFDANGLLPPGDYTLTLADLSESFLVNGPDSVESVWDSAWRRTLVDNLGVMCRQLWHVGIENIFIDGSFVEDKARPNDIDGYFECELRHLASGELTRELNLLDPHKIWT